MKPWVQESEDRVPVGFGRAIENDLAERLVGWLSSSSRIAGGVASPTPPDPGSASLVQLIRMLDALPDSLLLLDNHGVVTWASAATSEVLGWAPEQLAGRSIAVIALEENLDQQQQLLDEVRRTGRSLTFSAQRRCGDGEVVEVSVSMAPVHDSATGAMTGIIASVRRASPQARLQTPLAPQDSLSMALGRRSSDVALIANADTEITYISPSVRDVLGFTPDQLVGSKGFLLVHEDDLAGVEAFVTRVLSRSGTVERATFRVTNAAGEWLWIEETLTNCLDIPGVNGLVANVRDVTTEVEARAALTASEHRYRTIVETAQEGVLVLDDNSRVMFANRKAAEMLGHARSKLFRRQLTSFVDGRVKEVMQSSIATRTDRGHERYEITYPHPDGGSRVFEVAASPISLEAGASGSLAMISDVTDARRLEGELLHQALHDVLTGLPNRALLADRLAMALSREQASADQVGVAVLSIDLDGFRLINDAHGHEFGDAILIEVAQRLRSASRRGDTVARIGGDEFLVVAEGVGVDEARALAEHMRAVLLEPVVVGTTTVYVDASVGVASNPSQSPSSLLRCADDALHQAKAHGRGRVHVYDASYDTDTDTRRKLQVANGLRKALEADQLTLGYQPIVDLTEGHVVAVEALLRWEHPDLGAIPPVELVATAHSIGLAERLDECVLRRACADMAQLTERGVGTGLRLAVNLSSQTLEGGKLLQMVTAVTSLGGWPLGRLTLEVTEGVLMSDTRAAAIVLERLRELGVSVSIDDFGTGYSSLAYLRQLPVATLKIDRSFVEHLPMDPESCALARSITDLARALSLSTIAEGIETQDQADYMRALGCTRGQGFLWSPAVSPTQLEELLVGWP